MRIRKPLSFVAGGALAVASLVALPATAFASTSSAASATSSGPGIIAISQTGTVTGEDGAQIYGSVTGSHTVVAATPTPDGGGYWIVTRSGHVFAYGDAKYYGDTYTDGLTGLSGAKPLNAPIVGIAADPSGTGYWLVASDGGVFNFGSAPFLGSTYTYGVTGFTGKRPLDAPVTSMVLDPSGTGYWLVASDGGVFNFGSAPFLGSSYSLGYTGLGGSKPLSAPIMGAVAAPSGNGIALVGQDGSTLNVGSAPSPGSVLDLGYTGPGGKNPLPAKVTSLVVNPNGSGYYAVLGNGKVLAIGGAPQVPDVPVAPNGKVFVIPNKLQNSQPSQPLVPIAPKVPVAPQEPQGGGGGATGGGRQQIEPAIQVPTTSYDTIPGQTMQLTASGGDGSYSWGASAGMPDWLNLSSSGELSLNVSNLLGSQSLTTSFTVTIESGYQVTTIVLNVTAQAPSLTTSSFTATGSSSPYSVSGQVSVPSSYGSGYTYAESGTWPSGLSLSSSGALSGTIASAATGLEVALSYNGDLLGDVPISIALPSPLTMGTLPSSMYPGQSIQLTASGGSGSYTWSLVSLPSLYYLSSSGVLTVNSTEFDASSMRGDSYERIEVSSGSGSALSAVEASFKHPTLSTEDYTSGASPDIQLAVASGEGTGYTYAESGTWPSGLTLSSSGVIGGTLSASASSLGVYIEYNDVLVNTVPIALTYSP
ncbi:hypothetical protein [Ferrimicrobium sp.]|uniref:hypothetical protein n=1 Tax=Ferrimicrobium sp. TaxID=2926050 RepID=UPI00260173AB|nr:hypothetical protein [Ferrimicrobium sp.]